MKKIIMNKTLIAAAITLAFAPVAMADTGADAPRYPFSIAFGGGAMKMAAPVETYAPAWLSEYGADFPGPVTFSDDPEWGHLREASLTWSPTPSWKVVGAYRYGKASAASRGSGYELVPGGLRAGFKYATDPTDVTYEAAAGDNRWVGDVQIQEELEIVDFKLGRDIGIGGSAGVTSVFSVGVRYAELHSATQTNMDGVPDRYSPALFDTGIHPNLPERHHTHYTHDSSAQRDFEGYGPTLSWESGVGLLGNPRQGRVTMDWALAGGVLFGEQTSLHEEKRAARYYQAGAGVLNPTSVLYDETVSTSRRKDATVPHLSLALGLSYEIQRVQVSLRYSWERYFDAVDGGLDARKTYDRTVQGPVAQVSIGFGE